MLNEPSTSNPFSSPVKAVSTADSNVSTHVSIDFAVLAAKWERYRIVYNAALILWTFVATVRYVTLIRAVDLFGLCVIGAVAANILFFLGVTADGYCQWILRSKSKVFGIAILALGILVSLLLVEGSFFEIAR